MVPARCKGIVVNGPRDIGSVDGGGIAVLAEAPTPDCWSPDDMPADMKRGFMG